MKSYTEQGEGGDIGGQDSILAKVQTVPEFEQRSRYCRNASILLILL